MDPREPTQPPPSEDVGPTPDVSAEHDPPVSFQEAEDALPAGEVERPSVGPILVAGAVLALAVGIFAYLWRDHLVTGSHYLLLSMLLFAAGAVGVMVRRNALILFMCIELMLNAVNIAFVTFARMRGAIDGQVIVLFVMIVAAAEVAVGLAIIVSIFRSRLSANVDDVSELRL